jgi:transposase-like protein
MKTFKVSSTEKKEIIKEYLDKGLTQSEIAKMLGISRQLVRYWVLIIKDEK